MPFKMPREAGAANVYIIPILSRHCPQKEHCLADYLSFLWHQSQGQTLAFAQVKSGLQAARVKLRQQQAVLSSPNEHSDLRAIPAQNTGSFIMSRGPAPQGQFHRKQDSNASLGMPAPVTSALQIQQDTNHMQPNVEPVSRRDPAAGVAAGDHEGRHHVCATSTITCDLTSGKQMEHQARTSHKHMVDSEVASFQLRHLAVPADALDPDECCVVCMEAPVQTVFQPCGHAVTCKSCADKICNKGRECPMCRSFLQGIVDVNSCNGLA